MLISILVGSARDSHSKIQRSISQTQTCIHATSASRERALRIKRFRRFRHLKSRSLIHSRVGQDQSSSRTSSDTEMVVHAAHYFLLSDHQEVDQQVKECRRICCQSHSGEDSVRSECAHHSRKESVKTRKESITS